MYSYVTLTTADHNMRGVEGYVSAECPDLPLFSKEQMLNLVHYRNARGFSAWYDKDTDRFFFKKLPTARKWPSTNAKTVFALAKGTEDEHCFTEYARTEIEYGGEVIEVYSLVLKKDLSWYEGWVNRGKARHAEQHECLLCDGVVKELTHLGMCFDCYVEKYDYCKDCGGISLKRHLYDARDGQVCYYCFVQYRQCVKCEHWHSEGVLTGVGFFCDDCAPTLGAMKCSHCKKYVDKGDEFVFNKELYCEDCATELFKECVDCGKLVSKDDVREVGGELYCEDCFGREFFECHECGELVSKDEGHNDHYGNTLCESCFDDRYTHCDQCDAVVVYDNIVEAGGYYYCPRCRDAYLAQCDHCEEWILLNYSHSDNHTVLCESCFDEHYVYCYDCDTIISIDGAYCEGNYYYCGDCRDDSPHEIHSYSYEPRQFNFFGGEAFSHTLFMGVELEIDLGGENADNAGTLIDIAGGCDKIYAKHDGSLRDGFELVTHPMTLECHLGSVIDWKSVCKKAVQLGYKSHDTQTCGLHVHLSRRAFGVSIDERDTNIMKLLYLVERFWDNWVRFTRRSESQLDRWAARYGLRHSAEEILDIAKGSGRYKAVNITKSSTVELRLFRGTLLSSTLFATLQMCHELWRISMELDIQDIYSLEWEGFVGLLNPDFTELHDYLATRKLVENK